MKRRCWRGSATKGQIETNNWVASDNRADVASGYMPRLLSSVFIAVVLLCHPERVEGQSIPGPAASVLIGKSALFDRPDPNGNSQVLGGLLGDGSRDYRYTGFWVGAGTVGIYGLLWFLGCEDSDMCSRSKLAWRVPVAAAGTGLLGALIGSLVPKSRSAADSLRDN
jgi:hypothetical protein